MRTLQDVNPVQPHPRPSHVRPTPPGVIPSSTVRGRVFVTQQPRPNHNGWTPDLSSASEYGSLHFVFQSHDVPSADTTVAHAQARHILRTFNHQEDFILWPQTGDPFALIAVNFVLAEKRVPFVTFLNWNRYVDGEGTRDRRRGFYTPVRVPNFTGAR